MVACKRLTRRRPDDPHVAGGLAVHARARRRLRPGAPAHRHVTGPAPAEPVTAATRQQARSARSRRAARCDGGHIGVKVTDTRVK